MLLIIGFYVIVKVVANSFKIKDFAMKAFRSFNNQRKGQPGRDDIEAGKDQFRRQMILLM